MSLIIEFYNNFLEIIHIDLFGINLIDFLIIFISIIFSLFIREFFATLVVGKLKTFIHKTGNKIDDYLFDALIPPFRLLPMVVTFLIITLYLDINTPLGIYFLKINNTFLTVFVFWLFHQSLSPISFFLNKLEKLLSKAMVLWIINSFKYLIIFLGVVAVLELWGIKIGPIIAGLGLFGVAVALGAQDLFKNLISGIMILLEKRFHIGDTIDIPGYTQGTVEHIGFRSTLIRKFDSTPISIPNYIFAEAPISNFTNRKYRRINWIIGLEYKSTIEQLRSLTNSIDEYINNNSNFFVNDDYKCLVRVEKFNDSSIDILVYCFTSTNEWDKYLGIKENLAIEIKNIADNLNLSFAFPSQSIYIERKK